MARKRVSGKARNRRKNAAFVRQGEWFFLPVGHLPVDDVTQAFLFEDESATRTTPQSHFTVGTESQ